MYITFEYVQCFFSISYFQPRTYCSGGTASRTRVFFVLERVIVKRQIEQIMTSFLGSFIADTVYIYIQLKMETQTARHLADI